MSITARSLRLIFTMPVTAGHTFLKYKSLLMMFSKMAVGHISTHRAMRAEAREQDMKSDAIFTPIDACFVQNHININKKEQFIFYVLYFVMQWHSQPILPS